MIFELMLKSPAAFIKENLDLPKIREVKDHPDFDDEVAKVMTDALSHSGVKGTILPIIAQDIMKMLITQYAGLSIAEVCKAFELERYRAYEDKTDHFQLFNAPYVAEILIKYKKWKTAQMIAHNISLMKAETPEPYSDRTEAFKYFETFKKTKTIEGSGNINCVYEFLWKEKVLPLHDSEFKKKYLQMAIMLEVARAKINKYKKPQEELQAEIDEIKSNPARYETRWTGRRLILQDYFQDLLNRGIDLADEI